MLRRAGWRSECAQGPLASLLWLAGLSREEGVSLSQGLPARSFAPSRPFPDAGEVMINSGLALSPPSAPLGPTPSAAPVFRRSQATRGRVRPLPAASPRPFRSPRSHSAGGCSREPPPPPRPPAQSLLSRGTRRRGGLACFGARGRAFPSAQLPVTARPAACPPGSPAAASSSQLDLGGAGRSSEKYRGLQSHRLECLSLPGKASGEGNARPPPPTPL